MRACFPGSAALLLALLQGMTTGPAWAQADAQTLLAAARAVEARQADAWLASVEAQLRLTAAQQPAYAAYAAAIRAQAELKAAHRSAGLFVDTAQLPPAPDAIGRRVAQLQERAAALARVQAAAAVLYAELAPQQRTAFDFLAVTATGLGAVELN
jgi:hypothetical protein